MNFISMLNNSTIPQSVLEGYLFVFGLVLCIISTIEFINPLRAFNLWKRWVYHPLFFLHGFFITLLGFPMCIYNGPLSKGIFLTGIIIVLTGPFILFFPERIRESFTRLDEDMKDEQRRSFIIIDALIRMLVGGLCILSSVI